MLVLPSRGRNLVGMDSHVLRPMMTALVRPGEGGSDVTFLKCFISPGRRHGWKQWCSVRAYEKEISVNQEEKSKVGVRKCEERKWSNRGEDVGPTEKPSFVRGI